MSATAVDVVVVGAGISGLSCARYLLRKDTSLKVMVVEAKDRVGGRTLSVPMKTATGTNTWDLGAHWVGRCQPHIMRLIEELELQVHPQYLKGRKFLQVGKDNSIKSYSSDIPTLSLLGLLDLDRAMKKIDTLAREISQSDPYGHKRAAEFDGMTLETYINNTMWIGESKETLSIAIRAVLGVELADVSLLYFLTYVSAAGGLKQLVEATPFTAQEYTVQGGTQQISLSIAEELGDSRLRLSEPVTSITQEEHLVTVTTNNGSVFKCKKVVLAIPPNQFARIQFVPAIPTVMKELHKRMPMSNYVKFLITYKQAFWRDQGYSGEIVTNGGPCHMKVACSCGPLSFSYDDTSASGDPALVAFMAGSQAIDWRQQTPENRRKAVLEGLAQFFGAQVHEYVDFQEKDWDSEPFCEGGPVCCATPGAMRFYVQGLRKPVGNIHLAGTETATVWTGYMSGAVQAGYRAAMEVLECLRPGTVSQQEVEQNEQTYKPVC
ncbi:probable flavin-containing monoamine oxidase A [Dreissena polymorpha]|uniref:Amine oxidase n=1 Tax=Dreissena polymorpha TaxID=45954 RepID=A0A9D4MA34_DREPO|nr:probable flavin-containing monoamine oxidase A [Dreissena polymorpha]KAH3872451.1 hypothetical protein DPMN_035667 [Dreissena polymorpha]